MHRGSCCPTQDTQNRREKCAKQNYTAKLSTRRLSNNNKSVKLPKALPHAVAKCGRGNAADWTRVQNERYNECHRMFALKFFAWIHWQAATGYEIAAGIVLRNSGYSSFYLSHFYIVDTLNQFLSKIVEFFSHHLRFIVQVLQFNGACHKYGLHISDRLGNHSHIGSQR